MSKKTDLLQRIKSGAATWKDYAEFLELPNTDIEIFLEFAQEITKKNFKNILKVYNPSKKFPAISITGNECALHCEHCNKKYLDSMKPILNPNDLEKYLIQLHEEGGVGTLISGGCEPNGSVPLLDFLDTIKKVKNKTDLVINAHTGLLNEDTAKKLAEANVDIISFDINMDEEIIENIYHLERDLKEYKTAVSFLQKYDLNIVPHICIGLYYGKLHKELESIKFIKEIDPSLIVLIALIPPKEKGDLFGRPKPHDIAKIIATLRFLLPKTELSLGCMRPRGNIKVEVEKLALRAGITRIEIPSRKTLKWLKEVNPDIKLRFYSACCAIPEKYEEFAASSEKDVKRFLDF